jgi:hypothetical protein
VTTNVPKASEVVVNPRTLWYASPDTTLMDTAPGVGARWFVTAPVVGTVYEYFSGAPSSVPPVSITEMVGEFAAVIPGESETVCG